MPNRQTHTTIGIITGVGVTAYRARHQSDQNILLEMVGGGIGGYMSSRLPDVIEPASWPGHRQLAHSAATGAVIATTAYKLIGEWEEWCRSKAEYYHNRKSDETINWFEKFLYALLEILLHIASGTLSGLSAGYLSHLILDGCSPNGLPVFQ